MIHSTVLHIAWILVFHLCSSNATSIDIDIFNALSETEQRLFLRSSLKHRVETTKNVRLAVEIRMFNAMINELDYECDRHLKDEEHTGYIRAYTQHRIGSSYRSEMKHAWTNGKTNSEVVHNLFDADANVNKGYVTREGGLYAAHGRISDTPDVTDSSMRLNFWFQGRKNQFGTHVFQELLSAVDEAAIGTDLSSGLVVLTYAVSKANSQVVSRRFGLDPSKCCLPVFSRHRIVNDKEEVTWFDAFDVLESKRFNNVDIPVAIREVQSNDPQSSNHQAAIYDIDIKDIEIGAVNRDDLKLVFPEKTRVVNIFKQIAYTTGENEEVSGVVQSLGQRTDEESSTNE